MSRCEIAPNTGKRHQREARGSRSRNGQAGMQFNQLNVTGEKMKLRELAAGYVGLGAYTGLTQTLGINFFQLPPDHRALWMVGAVCVLGIVTSIGWCWSSQRR